MKKTLFALSLLSIVVAGCSDNNNVWPKPDVVFKENTQPPRFEIVQSYVYNLNDGGAIVRMIVLRDRHNGDEYVMVRDPDTHGLTLTRLTASGK